MTEITANSGALYPKAKATRQLVDPVAFVLAMVGAPLLVGIVGAPLILIPSIATLLGGPIYLMVGIPVMLIYMAHRKVSPRRWAGVALLGHLALFTPIFLVIHFTDQHRTNEWPFIFLSFGSVFAPFGAPSAV